MSGTGKLSAGAPTRLRSFDPVRVADLEYQVWVGYYRRQWHRVLIASVGLVRVGFGMNWYRTLHGAWLVLRANQLWAPYPDNDPKRAQACMQRFYALITLAWACLTSGSGKAAGRTAGCSRWNTPPWSVATPPCSPPSITDPPEPRGASPNGQG
jgi:hypothetical protein